MAVGTDRNRNSPWKRDKSALICHTYLALSTVIFYDPVTAVDHFCCCCVHCVAHHILIDIRFGLPDAGIDFYVSYELGNDRVCFFSSHSVLFVLLKSVFTLATIKAHENTLGNKVSRAISYASRCAFVCNSHSFTCLLLLNRLLASFFTVSLPLVYLSNEQGFAIFCNVLSLCGHENSALTPNGLLFMITCVQLTDSQLNATYNM